MKAHAKLEFMSFWYEKHPRRASWLACVPFAELKALGNTDFVNTHYPNTVSPMVVAAQERSAEIILKMIQCGGNPEKQGSDWSCFFMAANSPFGRDMARAIHSMMNLSSVFLVS